MSQLVILSLTLITISIISAVPVDFTCIDDECSCSKGECSHTCLTNECAKKNFICTSAATLCLINCYGQDSCKEATIYGNADNVIINCNGTSSCDGTEIFCGSPKVTPISYTADEFNGIMTDCFVNLISSNAMSFGEITCDGSIKNCIVDAYKDNSISQSILECSTDRIDGNGCQLNCIEPTSCLSIEFECSSSLCSCGILDAQCLSPQIRFVENTMSDVETTQINQAEDNGDNNNNNNNNNNRMLEVIDQYNCMELDKSSLEMRSIVTAGRRSTFQYEICGKDGQHNTIYFRYKYVSEDGTSSSLSGSVHDIHRSVDFEEHEENGKTYEFEWEYNEPNILCWLNDELSAIKIDLYYNKNTSFAFTYIYSEDILKKQNARFSDRYILTAKNNWNLGITYLENGYIYFDYEYNVTLSNPLTLAPTVIPTVNPTSAPTPEPTEKTIVINPEQTTTDDSASNVDSKTGSKESNKKSESESESEERLTAYEGKQSTTNQPEQEREVIETTKNNEDEAVNQNESVAMNENEGTTETPIKGLLFCIALVALCSICCIIGCVIWNRRKRRKEGMEAEYVSAAGIDSDDEENRKFGGGIGLKSGDQGDIEEEEEDDDHYMDEEENIAAMNQFIPPGNNGVVSDATSNEIEDRRIGSGILDEEDLMDPSEYNQLKMNADMNDNKNKRDSQSSLIKKYKKIDPNAVLPAKYETISGNEESKSKTMSESGIGYIAASKLISTADLSDNEEDDHQGISDDEDESLMVRDRDISMDAEYHHVITEQPEISIIEDDELIMERMNNSNRRGSISISEDNNNNNDENGQYNTVLIRRSISSMDDMNNNNNISSDRALPSASVTYNNRNNNNNTLHTKGLTSRNEHASNTTLGFEPGSVLDHYVNQDSTFQTLKHKMNNNKNKNDEEDEEEQSISRLSQSLVIPPIEFHEEIGNVKTVKTKSTVQSAAASMKMFSQKIANCAAKFGHDHGRTTEKKKSKELNDENIMDDDDNDNDDNDDNDDNQDMDDNENGNQFATMVIYKNKNISQIPESQIIQSTTPPPIATMTTIRVNKFLEPESTQTMIVKKDIHTIKESKSLDTQLTQLHQSSHDTLLSDDSSDSSDDDDGRDPIDASEEDEVINDKKRHKKNLSSISDKSHHERRTMIINDDLNIDHVINAMDDHDDDQ